jgi:hypothetical protein
MGCQLLVAVAALRCQRACHWTLQGEFRSGVWLHTLLRVFCVFVCLFFNGYVLSAAGGTGGGSLPDSLSLDPAG